MQKLKQPQGGRRGGAQDPEADQEGGEGKKGRTEDPGPGEARQEKAEGEGGPRGRTQKEGRSQGRKTTQERDR